MNDKQIALDKIAEDLKAIYRRDDRRLEVFHRAERILSIIVAQPEDWWVQRRVDGVDIDFNLYDDDEDEPTYNLGIYLVVDGRTDTSRGINIYLKVL